MFYFNFEYINRSILDINVVIFFLTLNMYSPGEKTLNLITMIDIPILN